MKNSLLIAFMATATLAVSQNANLYFPPLAGQTWETVPPTSLGWCEGEIQPLYDYLEGQNSKAFIVLKDGRIVLEKYFGTFERDSFWYWASAGKTLTAALVGIAQQEGLLSISDLSQQYLGNAWTGCGPAAEAGITVRHQLTMTSGLDDGVADPYCTLPNCLNCLAEPGSRWAYHNAPYTLLDGVIEGASGQTLNQFFNTRVRNKTGILGLFYQAGYNNIFASTARSMARFGLLMLNRGNWNGTPVLADSTYFHDMTRPSQTLNPSYGYLWWLNGQQKFMLPGSQIVFPGQLFPDAPAEMFSALGKNGQSLNVVPGEGLVVVRMGNSPGTGLVDAFLVNETWKRLNKVICLTSQTSGASGFSKIQIFPNPTDGVFRIGLPAGGKTSAPGLCRVFDFSGKLVFEKNWASGEGTLDVSALPPGAYLLKTVDNEGVVRAGRFLKT